MRDLWERITRWFSENGLPEEFELPPGAAAEQIKDAESFLGLELPDDVRESCTMHNGSGYCGLFIDHDLMSLDEIKNEWSAWTHGFESGMLEPGVPPYLTGPIKPVLWNRKWIPITQDGSGDHYCVDMDPPLGGEVGQVIYHSHETGPVNVLASSFRGLFLSVVEDLENGKYYYDRELPGLVKKATE